MILHKTINIFYTSPLIKLKILQNINRLMLITYCNLQIIMLPLIFILQYYITKSAKIKHLTLLK